MRNPNSILYPQRTGRRRLILRQTPFVRNPRAFETPIRKMKRCRHWLRGTLGFGTKAMPCREKLRRRATLEIVLRSSRAGYVDSSEQGGCQRPAGRLTVTRIWERSIDVCEKEVKRESEQNRNICCAICYRHLFVVV